MRHLRHLPAREGQEEPAEPEPVLTSTAFRFSVCIAAVVALGFPLCPIGGLTGVPCPGCGLLRAAVALVSGNPGESLHYHPLAAVALPAATLGAWHVATGWPSSPSARKCLAVISAILVVALVAVWVARFFGAFGGPVYVRRFWER